MQIKKVGVITLAITLIALGTLFLLNNFIDIQVMTILSIIWPMIIIALGFEIIIFKLIFERKSDNIKMKIDGVSLFILIFIIIVTSVTSSVSIFIPNIHMFSSIVGGYKYETKFDINKTIVTESKNKVIINNSQGNVDVNRSTGDQLEIDALIRVKNNDEEYAKEISDKIIEIDTDKENIIEITTNSQRYTDNSNKINSIRVEYSILVPEGIELEVTNGYGNVEIDNVPESVKINNSHGIVRVQYIGGDLEVDNSYGNVYTNDVKGKAEINNKHANVTVRTVGGDLDIDNPYGTVDVEQVKGRAEISSTHNNVIVEEVEGDVTVSSSYSRIEVKDIGGSLKAEGNNGSMEFEGINGQITANNRHGNIRVVKSSKDINLRTKNGEVYFETKNLLEKSLNIENEYGNITINIPENQTGKIEAYTEYGEIYDDFGLRINKGLNEQNVNQVLSKEEVQIFLKTRNGNIRIQRN